MNLGNACNSVQGATVSVALTATSATCNLQLTDSKRNDRVRIPPSPPTWASVFLSVGFSDSFGARHLELRMASQPSLHASYRRSV